MNKPASLRIGDQHQTAARARRRRATQTGGVRFPGYVEGCAAVNRPPRPRNQAGIRSPNGVEIRCSPSLGVRAAAAAFERETRGPKYSRIVPNRCAFAQSLPPADMLLYGQSIFYPQRPAAIFVRRLSSCAVWFLALLPQASSSRTSSSRILDPRGAANGTAGGLASGEGRDCLVCRSGMTGVSCESSAGKPRKRRLWTARGGLWSSVSLDRSVSLGYGVDPPCVSGPRALDGWHSVPSPKRTWPSSRSVRSRWCRYYVLRTTVQAILSGVEMGWADFQTPSPAMDSEGPPNHDSPSNCLHSQLFLAQADTRDQGPA